MRKRTVRYERPSIQIAPMIDCVFLMLVYFMVTSTLEREEADLAFQLPGRSSDAFAAEAEMDEQWVEIAENGQVSINGYELDSPESEILHQLTGVLTEFMRATQAAGVQAVVTIAPSSETAHQYIVRVMDAVARAGLTQVHFALDSEPW